MAVVKAHQGAVCTVVVMEGMMSSESSSADVGGPTIEQLLTLWTLLPQIRSTLTYYSTQEDRVGDINMVDGKLRYGRRADELLSKLPEEATPCGDLPE